jgi:hypothetical protein
MTIHCIHFLFLREAWRKEGPSKLIPVLRDKKSSNEMARGWKCVHGSRKKWLGKIYNNKGK